MKTDLDTIERLATLMETANLSSVEICEGETRISLKRPEPAAAISAPAYGIPAGGAALPPVQAAVPPLAPTSSVEEGSQVVDFNGMKELKSPMVGVVYTAPEPGAEPFVKPGSRVKKGQVLCIIEAMKLMNEYTAPEDGEILDICIQNEELVEFGQVLFKMV
ncbi:MAG: acetyl-CoA carboxylase biotin carboxyl carrier protein [Hydrogeniiclostridium sp.]